MHLTSLMMLQPGLCQINVPLDAAQDFIVDHVLVAQFKNRPAFLQERFVRQALVFGRKAAERRARTFRLGALGAKRSGRFVPRRCSAFRSALRRVARGSFIACESKFSGSAS